MTNAARKYIANLESALNERSNNGELSEFSEFFCREGVRVVFQHHANKVIHLMLLWASERGYTIKDLNTSNPVKTWKGELENDLGWYCNVTFEKRFYPKKESKCQCKDQ